jgi:hypothetical protein
MSWEKIVLLLLTVVTIFVTSVSLLKQYRPKNTVVDTPQSLSSVPTNRVTSTDVPTEVPTDVPIPTSVPSLRPSPLPTSVPPSAIFPTAPPISQSPREKDSEDD